MLHRIRKKLTRYQLATKISVYMDLSKRMNNELNQVSPCLIVNHENEFEKACVECLQSTHLENSKYESRMSASPFNHIVATKIHQKLVNCITTASVPACIRISFVNEEFCAADRYVQKESALARISLLGLGGRVQQFSFYQ